MPVVGNLERPPPKSCSHHFPNILKPKFKAVINIIDYRANEDFIIVDPVAHLTIGRLECVVGGRDMVLYFAMCLEVETLGLPATSGL